jgi:hypothetical protein
MLFANCPALDQVEGVRQEGSEEEGVKDGSLGHHHDDVVHAHHHPVVLFAASVFLPLLLFALPEFPTEVY